MRCFVVAAGALLLCAAAQAQVDVLANRYGPLGQAANTSEQKLNTANVNAKNFGKLFSYYVDGAVYAQPLFVHGVEVAGMGRRDVLYVATMNDKVYAFDGTKRGAPLWVRDLTDEAAGVTPVPVSDITNSNDLNVVGNAGVEGTPVIDAASHCLYLVARTKENGSYVQRLHKLDLRDGKDQVAPALIEAKVKGAAADARDGMVVFDPRAGNQRAALAMANGNVVIAWASHEDLRPYHGWIMAYDATSLRQTGALCLTPDMADGGVWQSGRGPAVDDSGGLYFEVGNGGWDGKRNFGNSVIKVESSKSGLAVEDYYTPHDYAHQNETDADLGSSGPMLMPEMHTLICGNKQGELVLLDAKHLGKLTPNDSGVEEAVNLKSGRILGGPAYWNGPQGGMIFDWNEAGVMQMYRFQGKLLDGQESLKGSVRSHGSPGGALTVSADGARAGTGIVWSTVSEHSADHGNAAGVLYAFNAETLAELWDSEQDAVRGRMGTLVKFVPPLVVDGRVYVPNYDNAVNVYGLLADQ